MFEALGFRLKGLWCRLDFQAHLCWESCLMLLKLPRNLQSKV